MTMLDDLVAEMRRRDWPEPDLNTIAGTLLWGDANANNHLHVADYSGGGVVCMGTAPYSHSVWSGVKDAADALDRMRAELKPGEIPCLDSIRSHDPATATIEDLLALVREPNAVSLCDCTTEFRSTEYLWGNWDAPNLVIYTTKSGDIYGLCGGVRREAENLHAMLSNPTVRAHYGLEKPSNRDLSLGRPVCVPPMTRSDCQNERPSFKSISDMAVHAAYECAEGDDDAREARIRRGYDLLPRSNTAFLLRRLDEARTPMVGISVAAGTATIPSIDTAAWNAERSQLQPTGHDWIGAVRKPFVPTM